MQLTASWPQSMVTDLESNPSIAKTPIGQGVEHSFPESGSVKDQQFANGITTAAASPVPAWKTILDRTCILISLPLWLPVVLIIALWIKLTSPGPVFFRQERVGYRGKRFMILKFRTMKVNVETRTHECHLEQLINSNAPMTKLDSAGDPRIIRGGRILRSTGLDELPQLFNVFRGEMSLVGPRPCTPHEFKKYRDWQKERVNVPPGLTGYWQVNGKNKTTFNEMIHLDIFYTRNLSLGLDFTIMFKTFPALMTQVIETRRAAAKLTSDGLRTVLDASATSASAAVSSVAARSTAMA